MNKKASSFQWIPESLKTALENISKTFTLGKKKYTIGFHVLKNEPNEFSVGCYIYPPPESGKLAVKIDKALEAFNGARASVNFDRTFLTHGCLTFHGRIRNFDVNLDIFLDRHKEGFNTWPPLIFDVFSGAWYEREPHPKDQQHGDETKTFSYWFFKQCPTAKEVHFLCTDECCRRALIKSFDAFNRHVRRSHIPDEITLDVIRRAHKAWQESLKFWESYS